MFYFNYNGRIVANGQPVMSADSRALRYGDGLFETIKMKNGRLEMEDEHFARLWKGMHVLQFDIPKQFTPGKLASEVIVLAKKNKHENNARIRLNVVRGNGGLYDASNHYPNYIIQSWPLPPDSGAWNSNGLVLGIYQDAKKSPDILSNLKHNNYLLYVLAALKAKSEKWNDAVVINTEGNVCDTTIANIFLIKDRVIYTPSLQQGCVAGVMRKKIIQAINSNGWQLIEKTIAPDELHNADEVFLTNSIINLRWVQSVDNTAYGHQITQEIYSRIFEPNP